MTITIPTLSNVRRRSLQKKYTEHQRLPPKRWTAKGVVSRVYGQGAQKLFSSFPYFDDVAVTGETCIALYDMCRWKKDLDWSGDVVDIFVAVPWEIVHSPLQMAFPLIIEWLEKVRSKGFDYKLAVGGSLYGPRCISFDFDCHNKNEHPSVKVPRVKFSICIGDSV